MNIKIDNNAVATIINDTQHKGQNSNDYIHLEFEFSEYWSDFNKYIEFVGKDLNKVAYLISDNKFDIPSDISEHQEVTCNLFMKKTENGVTEQTPTNQWKMYFEPSINANPSMIEEKPDVIDQLVTDVEELKEAGGEPNVIDTIKVNGTEQTVTDKTVNITVPTKTSDLNNDSGFITNTVNDLVNYYLKADTYTQAEVNALIGAITTLNILVVQTLPTQDISTNTIYFVPKNPTEQDNIYDEYIYVNNNWELIGTTAVNLEHYIQDDDYATSSKAGVFKTGYGAGLLSDGKIFAGTRTYAQYQNDDNKFFISKGTLENVLTERIGDIETALHTLNEEWEAI